MLDGSENVLQRIAGRRIKYFGHVERMSDYRFPYDLCCFMDVFMGRGAEVTDENMAGHRKGRLREDWANTQGRHFSYFQGGTILTDFLGWGKI